MFDNTQNVKVEGKEVANAILTVMASINSDSKSKKYVVITDSDGSKTSIQRWNIKYTSSFDGRGYGKPFQSILYMYSGDNLKFELSIDELHQQLALICEQD